MDTSMAPYRTDNLPPIHPGSVLRNELDAMGLSARKFAAHIHVPHNAVTGILNGQRSVTARMAIRLGLASGTTPHYRQNLQPIYNLKRAMADVPATSPEIAEYSAA